MRFSKTYFLAPWILAFWETLLQQYLPFTVLKLYYHAYYKILLFKKGCNSTYRLRYWNRLDASHIRLHRIREVATVLTVYGIETSLRSTLSSLPLAELQQYLPFTVLKRDINAALFPVFKGCNSTYRLRYWNWLVFFNFWSHLGKLQQYLPFMVLKLIAHECHAIAFG